MTRIKAKTFQRTQKSQSFKMIVMQCSIQYQTVFWMAVFIAKMKRPDFRQDLPVVFALCKICQDTTHIPLVCEIPMMNQKLQKPVRFPSFDTLQHLPESLQNIVTFFPNQLKEIVLNQRTIRIQYPPQHIICFLPTYLFIRCTTKAHRVIQNQHFCCRQIVRQQASIRVF